MGKQLNAVLLKKCKKEKYRKKHGKRCQDLKSFADNAVEVDQQTKGRCRKAKYRSNHPELCANVEKFVLKDIRCKKAIFRKNYPDLCPGVAEDDIFEDKEEDPDWLEDRCKHKNFRLKNADICRDLCPQNKWSKLYRDICDGLVGQEITDEQNSIIDSAIEDIKDIVSKETTKQSTSAQTSTTSTTTTASTTTTTSTTTHTTTSTSTTTTISTTTTT